VKRAPRKLALAGETIRELRVELVRGGALPQTSRNSCTATDCEPPTFGNACTFR